MRTHFSGLTFSSVPLYPLPFSPFPLIASLLNIFVQQFDLIALFAKLNPQQVTH